MDKCNYINHHTFKLRKSEKETYNYFTFQSERPCCAKCGKCKDVVNVIKNSISKTMKNVASITGQIKINSKCKANDRFYCKHCDLFF